MAIDISTVAYALTDAIYSLKKQGVDPTRIDMRMRFIRKLIRELDLPDDPEWNPPVGAWAGEFMAVDVYVAPETDPLFFFVITAPK